MDGSSGRKGEDAVSPALVFIALLTPILFLPISFFFSIIFPDHNLNSGPDPVFMSSF